MVLKARLCNKLNSFWVGVLRPVGIWGHLQGENIQLYNLFSPVMMITWWRRQSPSLFDKWHGIFHMPSRIDTAVLTKAFDYPVAEHWGGDRNVQPREDSNRQHIGSHLNALPTEPSRLPRRITYPRVLNRGDLLPTFLETYIASDVYISAEEWTIKLPTLSWT